jgi:hypothetical protein
MVTTRWAMGLWLAADASAVDMHEWHASITQSNA